MTKKQTRSIVVTALIGNALHFILCYLYNLLYYSIPQSYLAVLSAVFCVFSLLLWFCVGACYKRSKTYTTAKGIALAFVAVIPILVFVLLQQFLPVPTVSATQSWMMFFSFGAPVIFWLNPFLYFAPMLSLSFGAASLISIALILLVTFLGAALTHSKEKLAEEKEPVADKTANGKEISDEAEAPEEAEEVDTEALSQDIPAEDTVEIAVQESADEAFAEAVPQEDSGEDSEEASPLENAIRDSAEIDPDKIVEELIKESEKET
jgi:hypothetical protein